MHHHRRRHWSLSSLFSFRFSFLIIYRNLLMGIFGVKRKGIFLVWAYVPERCLHFIGIYFYPRRYWALAVPAYSVVAIVLALSFYIGLNFMSTPSSTSLNTMFDEFSREPSDFALKGDEDERPIEPISDIGIHKINAVMFK
ncbi:hypothetical protein Ddye_022514 [Dipteronia dyeriana]|uniref:PIG-P domain-containing protein n=1 Tax=Dipteronia dyeriana TaxID=168575 RepID=A0AAD9TRD1_9ROSI|nr:hypothetical protein Ddye_022514 [Dipteronia dyeriana]